MKTRNFSRVQLLWFISLLVLVILVALTNRYHRPSHPQRTGFAESSPTILPPPISQPSLSARQSATPESNKQEGCENDILSILGRKFESSALEKQFGTPQTVPVNIQGSGESDRSFLYKTGQNTKLKALVITTRKERVIMLDVNIDNQSTGGDALVASLLQGFEKAGQHETHMLGSGLEEIKLTFNELHRKDSIGALTLQQAGITRVIFYDSASVSAAETLPSTSRLPTGLLDRARKIIEKQNELNKAK